MSKIHKQIKENSYKSKINLSVQAKTRLCPTQGKTPIN